MSNITNSYKKLNQIFSIVKIASNDNRKASKSETIIVGKIVYLLFYLRKGKWMSNIYFSWHYCLFK